MSRERDLFRVASDPLDAPLADRMRPRTLDEMAGQRHLIGPGKVLRVMADSGRLRPMVLWGPAGTGKTTLARILCDQAHHSFTQLSAVTAGIRDLRTVVDQARQRGGRNVLFVDEIHRWNKAQQDAFLPHVESGLLVLIGATTENPSFEVISALLSRCQVYTLHRLSEQDLVTVIYRALEDNERGLGQSGLSVPDDVVAAMAGYANGDARTALNVLELAADVARSEGARNLTLDHVARAVERPHLRHDKGGETQYNLLSALHKSLRGSDPDAAVYYLVRMIEAGDALSAARRMIAAASEDVGNADPRAVQIAVAAFQAYHALGSPEGDIPLAHAALYIACAPKSNAVVVALNAAREAVGRYGDLPTPVHLRNAPTALMKHLGYGREYQYAHDDPDALVAQTYLPDELVGQCFYHPSSRGYEKTIAERLAYWRELIRRKGGEKPTA